MLVDAPRAPKAAHGGERSSLPPVPGLPPVPSVHRGAPRVGEDPVLSNGAALYRDSAIPWRIEAVAREAMEESLE